MSSTAISCRVVILVKALPQPSKRYGETVCCAGLTIDRVWKRLYPVRFRQLQGESSFNRWDWITFQYRRPTSDRRSESCHVFEDTIRRNGQLRVTERAAFINPLIIGSAKEAAQRGQSLALIRPKNTRFTAKLKTRDAVISEKGFFQRLACQGSFFDKELSVVEPCPYQFHFKFEDNAGKHRYINGDWEAHAMFFRESRRTSATEALHWMDYQFNERYPKAGMVFAIGNQAKRPQTWQLLGVIRLDELRQGELPL